MFARSRLRGCGIRRGARGVVLSIAVERGSWGLVRHASKSAVMEMSLRGVRGRRGTGLSAMEIHDEDVGWKHRDGHETWTADVWAFRRLTAFLWTLIGNASVRLA
jgi:hypothetical protein